jgi:hypothetical protein
MLKGCKCLGKLVVDFPSTSSQLFIPLRIQQQDICVIAASESDTLESFVSTIDTRLAMSHHLLSSTRAGKRSADATPAAPHDAMVPDHIDGMAAHVR